MTNVNGKAFGAMPDANKVMVVVGTRPEVIKMLPLIECWRKHNGPMALYICAVNQQREILRDTLRECGLNADYWVEVVSKSNLLADRIASMISGIGAIIRTVKPRIVMVHGDTSTAVAGALSAAYESTQVAHVEAGLRTGRRDSPFPEEMNRMLIAQIAEVHYAPSNRCRHNLIREGIPEEKISVTGNTVVDALKRQIANSKGGKKQGGDKRILVTLHRRENIPSKCYNVCLAVLKMLRGAPDIAVDYVLHPNPNARVQPMKLLKNVPRCVLHEAVSPSKFVEMLNRSWLVMTDSGGTQEEAAYLRVPAFVLRECTERQELVDLGVAKLIGTDTTKIVDEVIGLSGDRDRYRQMRRRVRPYGNGHAAERICAHLTRWIARNDLSQ